MVNLVFGIPGSQNAKGKFPGQVSLVLEIEERSGWRLGAWAEENKRDDLQSLSQTHLVR